MESPTRPPQKVDVASGEDMQHEYWKGYLTGIYTIADPLKICNVPYLLNKYPGKAMELGKQIVDKYNDQLQMKEDVTPAASSWQKGPKKHKKKRNKKKRETRRRADSDRDRDRISALEEKLSPLLDQGSGGADAKEV